MQRYKYSKVVVLEAQCQIDKKVIIFYEFGQAESTAHC